MIRATVPTHLSLIELTTTPGSQERFDKLSHLLGEGIIGGVWFYASEDRDTILASLECLPSVVEAVGIGSSRFLKVWSELSPNAPGNAWYSWLNTLGAHDETCAVIDAQPSQPHTRGFADRWSQGVNKTHRRMCTPDALLEWTYYRWYMQALGK